VIKRIMVPLDGSALAEQALPLACSLASTLEAEVVLAAAIEEHGHYADRRVTGPEADRRVGAERAAAETYLAKTETLVTREKVRVRSAVASGRPHIVISSLCDLKGIDLLVMTTHGRSGVSRWAMGSVADKVLRTTNTPLILIHPTTHGRPCRTIHRIVVPLDGSELAEAALPLAARLAESLSVAMHLVRAVVPPTVIYGAEFLPGTLPILEDMESGAREYITALAERERSKGILTTTEVRMGMAAEVILAEAGEPGDMVVLSTHGRSGVDRWFLGSVADAVVRHGDVPVLVVRSWVTPEKLEDVKAAPLVVAGIPPVIPPPVMSEVAADKGPRVRAPAARPRRPEGGRKI
jgi:nucleotide-binding universal stress UspA family protein